AMDYYVTAVDANNNVIARAGEENAPAGHVSIVGHRTYAPPALPGRMPPEQCGETECPPGMTCSGHHTAGGPAHSVGGGNAHLGDPCSSDGECGDGLVCSEGSCAAGEHESHHDNGPSNRRVFDIDVGGGFGL